jgi:hypothetical protein
MTAPTTELDDRVPRWRRWTDLQSLRASLGSGLLGGLCCNRSGHHDGGPPRCGWILHHIDDPLPGVLHSGQQSRSWRCGCFATCEGKASRRVMCARPTHRRPAGDRVMAIVYVITLGIAMAVAQLLRM